MPLERALAWVSRVGTAVAPFAALYTMGTVGRDPGPVVTLLMLGFAVGGAGIIGTALTRDPASETRLAARGALMAGGACVMVAMGLLAWQGPAR